MKESMRISQGITVLAVGVLLSFFAGAFSDSAVTSSLESSSQLAQLTPSATLAFSPYSQSATVGNTFTVNIVLNTGGQAIYGVDINRLRFSPSILQVVDADTQTAGVQIGAGSLMALTVANTVDNAQGTVQFSQVANFASTYNGSGTLATITFRVVSAGVSPVTLDFTLGRGTDSNVAGLGGDLLASVGSGSYTGVATADTTAPTISALALSNVTSTGATISWTTNENADTQVEYGLTTAYGSMTALAPALAANHSASLTGLSAGTAYHYRVKSRDAAANLAVSGDNIFTTQALADTVPPSVPLGVTATPTGNDQIQVSWNASTDTAGIGQQVSGIADYKVFRGATLVKTTATTAFLDEGLSAETEYTYQVLATDVAGNESLKSTAVTATTLAWSAEVRRKIVIVLQGVPVGKRNISGTIEFLDPTSRTKVFQSSISTDSAGEYTVDIPRGLPSPVILRAVIPGYIAKLLMSVDLRDVTLLEARIPSLPAGDFNGDQRINTLDFSYMNGKWGGNDPLADIDKNGEINTLDFSYVSNNWMLAGE